MIDLGPWSLGFLFGGSAGLLLWIWLDIVWLD